MERMEIDANVALAGVGGLLVGGAAGAGLAYLLLRKSFQSNLDREVAAVKDHYHSQLAEIQTEHNDRFKKALSDALSVVPEAGNPFVGRSVSDLAGPGSDEELGEAALGAAGFEVADHFTEDDLRGVSIAPGDPLEGLEDGEEEPGDESADAIGYAQDAGRGASDDPPITRDLRRPYMISAAEFADSPPGWQQLTLKWFAADRVLVDDKNEPVNPFGKIVGLINGKKDFGGISGDPNIRYVRNQGMETDFEILFDPRSYAEVILNYGQPNRG
jgi:hypothetical protein